MTPESARAVFEPSRRRRCRRGETFGTAIGQRTRRARLCGTYSACLHEQPARTPCGNGMPFSAWNRAPGRSPTPSDRPRRRDFDDNRGRRVPRISTGTVGIALEMRRQRREADREVVAVAKPHTQRPVGGEGKAAELVGRLPRGVALLVRRRRRAAESRAIAPRASCAYWGPHPLRAAGIDVILQRSARRRQDLLALRRQLAEAVLVVFHLLSEDHGIRACCASSLKSETNS